jgi:hypothetical protein
MIVEDVAVQETAGGSWREVGLLEMSTKFYVSSMVRAILNF